MQHNVLICMRYEMNKYLLSIASCLPCLCKCVNTYIFYVYNIQILTVKHIRNMSVFMCVQGLVCAHICGGQRTALGISPQMLSIFFNIRSLFGLKLTGLHRKAWH